MLFSESVTSKQRFMQSRGVREKGTVILICPRRHSNPEWSDTSINSPSSTKFTLVFRKAQYFISCCRISQSYFQSQTCHHGVAVRQLVVIMTIYSSGSEELFFLQFSQPKRTTLWFYSLIASSHIFVFMIKKLSVFSPVQPSVCLPTLTCCRSVHLAICPSTRYSFSLSENFSVWKHNYTSYFSRNSKFSPNYKYTIKLVNL